jgi:hypothetical protein
VPVGALLTLFIASSVSANSAPYYARVKIGEARIKNALTGTEQDRPAAMFELFKKRHGGRK